MYQKRVYRYLDVVNSRLGDDKGDENWAKHRVENPGLYAVSNVSLNTCEQEPHMMGWEWRSPDLPQALRREGQER